MRSSALRPTIENFGSGSFAWELSLDNFCLNTFVWGPSLGDVRFGTFAVELARRTSAEELSLRNLGLGTFVLGNFRLETLAWAHCLGSLAWDLWLGIFGLGSGGELGS